MSEYPCPTQAADRGWTSHHVNDALAGPPLLGICQPPTSCKASNLAPACDRQPPLRSLKLQVNKCPPAIIAAARGGGVVVVKSARRPDDSTSGRANSGFCLAALFGPRPAPILEDKKKSIVSNPCLLYPFASRPATCRAGFWLGRAGPLDNKEEEGRGGLGSIPPTRNENDTWVCAQGHRPRFLSCGHPCCFAWPPRIVLHSLKRHPLTIRPSFITPSTHQIPGAPDPIHLCARRLHPGGSRQKKFVRTPSLQTPRTRVGLQQQPPPQHAAVARHAAPPTHAPRQAAEMAAAEMDGVQGAIAPPPPLALPHAPSAASGMSLPTATRRAPTVTPGGSRGRRDPGLPGALADTDGDEAEVRDRVGWAESGWHGCCGRRTLPPTCVRPGGPSTKRTRLLLGPRSEPLDLIV